MYSRSIVACSVIACAGVVTSASADIVLSSQAASVNVQGFVQSPNSSLGGYNHGPSDNTLLAPVNMFDGDSATSGAASIASDMTSTITGTAFGTTGLLITGSSLGHASSVGTGAVNTTVGAFQNYQLAFSIDAPTAIYLSVTIGSSSPVTSGSIGLLSNPNSIGWGAGPGTYEFNDVLSAGSYTFNMNTNLFYSTGGTTDSFASDATFRFELGSVPTPGAVSLIGLSGLAALRRRR